MFLIIDNGSAHRGKRSIDRLQGAWPNLIVVHTPVHASWLNQAEIYFSVIQRKVEGRWQGERLHPGDYVICADEKPSIQARSGGRRPVGAPRGR